MEKDFENFIASRCETALLENEYYLHLDRSDSDHANTQGVAEVLCYKKGFSDAIKLLNIN